LSHVRNARKKEDQTGIKERIIESGLVRSGGKPDVVFSSPTQDVCRVVIQADYLTTPNMRFMEKPSISICRVHGGIASDVIKVSIVVVSNAENAKRLERNEKVNSAIDALLRRIRNELYFAENTGTGDGMNGTGNSTGGLRRE
jgi:hypothetical protein